MMEFIKINKYLHKLKNESTESPKFGIYLTKLNYWYNQIGNGIVDGIRHGIKKQLARNDIYIKCGETFKTVCNSNKNKLDTKKHIYRCDKIYKDKYNDKIIFECERNKLKTNPKIAKNDKEDESEAG
jgi:hypothetical protein